MVAIWLPLRKLIHSWRTKPSLGLFGNQKEGKSKTKQNLGKCELMLSDPTAFVETRLAMTVDTSLTLIDCLLYLWVIYQVVESRN